MLRPKVLDSIFPSASQKPQVYYYSEPWDKRNPTEMRVHERFIVCYGPFICYGFYYIECGFLALQPVSVARIIFIFLLADFNCPDQEFVGPKTCRSKMNGKEKSFRLIGKTRAEHYLDLCLRPWVKAMFIELRNIFSFPPEKSYVLALSQDCCLPLAWEAVTFCLSCPLCRAVWRGLVTSWGG